MGRSVSGEGKARASFPKASIAAFSAMIPQAMVESSHAGDAARKNGRTATRSIRTPNATTATSAPASASGKGQRRTTNVQYAVTAPAITTWPCEKFIVRLVAHVMWYPRATRPYMLPSAKPVTTSWTSKKLLGGDRDDLAALPGHHDVVRVGEGVVLLGGERPLVGLDETLVLGLQVLERVLDLRPVRAS